MSTQMGSRLGRLPLSARSLRLLHVSDTHNDLDRIAQLKKHVAPGSVDLILLSGDIANMPMRSDLTLDEVEKYKQDAEAVVKALEEIQQPVLYIPGNHDPLPLFSTSVPLLGTSAVNVHRSSVRLAPNLLLKSFGGSVPGFRQGRHHWNGFPYDSDAAFEADLRPFLDLEDVEPSPSDDVHNLRQDDSILLMTHVGPGCSDTALDRSDHGSPEDPISGGSSFLGEALKLPAMQKRVFLNIHGHIHAGFGRSQIGRIDIINPGSLHEKHYALMTLTQNDSSKRWYVSTLTMECLPD